MLFALRRGQTLGNSIRTISFAYRSTQTLSHPTKWAYSSYVSRSRQAQNSFHTSTSQWQQAAARVADYGEAPTQPYSKFQELADNDVVHRTIIDTIVRRMRITDMTDIQKLTLHECLDGTDM